MDCACVHVEVCLSPNLQDETRDPSRIRRLGNGSLILFSSLPICLRGATVEHVPDAISVSLLAAPPSPHFLLPLSTPQPGMMLEGNS